MSNILIPSSGRRFELNFRFKIGIIRVIMFVRLVLQAIEIFLVKSVTHVVTDDPRCGTVSKTYHGSSVQKSADTIDRSVSPVPIKVSRTL